MKERRELKAITTPVSFYCLRYHFFILHAITMKVDLYDLDSNRHDGLVVRASALQSVDLGFIPFV